MNVSNMKTLPQYLRFPLLLFFLFCSHFASQTHFDFIINYPSLTPPQSYKFAKRIDSKVTLMSKIGYSALQSSVIPVNFHFGGKLSSSGKMWHCWGTFITVEEWRLILLSGMEEEEGGGRGRGRGPDVIHSALPSISAPTALFGPDAPDPAVEVEGEGDFSPATPQTRRLASSDEIGRPVWRESKSVTCWTRILSPLLSKK